jgi:transposase-like protein
MTTDTTHAHAPKKTAKPIDQARIEAIRAAILAGKMTEGEIADAFDISRGAVQHHIKRLGVRPKAPPRFFSEKHPERYAATVHDLQNTTTPLRVIAKRHKVAVETVQRIVERLPSGSVKPREPYRPQFSAAAAARAVELYQGGMRITAIAKEMGFHHNRISQVIREYKDSLRKPVHKPERQLSFAERLRALGFDDETVAACIRLAPRVAVSGDLA